MSVKRKERLITTLVNYYKWLGFPSDIAEYLAINLFKTLNTDGLMQLHNIGGADNRQRITANIVKMLKD